MADAFIRLRRWKKKERLSVAELARRAKCSRPMASLVLNGHRRPSLDLAVRIERLTMGAVRAVDWVPAPETEQAA